MEVDWEIEQLSTADVSAAASSCEFPLVLWDEKSTVILLVNQGLCDLVGLRSAEMVGRSAQQFVDMTEGVWRSLDALRTASLDDLRARRRLRTPRGAPIEVLVWTRTVEVDSKRCALSVVIPRADTPSFRQDPTGPWRQLAETAVGRLDGSGHISVVSAEISALLGGKPDEWLGVPLSDIVRADEAPLVRKMADYSGPAVADREVHLVHHDGGTSEAWLLVAADQSTAPPSRVFALVGTESRSAPSAQARVHALELRLRRIGAEVRAAGMLDVLVEDRPAERYFPQLAELSARQWDILARLRRGERVPTIARALFLSPSTVRNHLTSVYRRFGVHSQAELLALLHGPPPRPTGQTSEQ